MCGRFTLFDTDALAGEFGVPVRFDLAPQYNIAPTRQVAAVRSRPGGGRDLVLLRWGLIPWWAKDPSTIGARMINARSETAPWKPAFRDPFRLRRCMIPANGFYEWQKQGRARQPYHIRLRERNLMAIAALWDRWERIGSEPIESCTLLTTEANDLVAPLHDRMPVILSPENYDRWLDPSENDPAALLSLLTPVPSERMMACPVSRRVNDPSVDDAGVLDLPA